MVQRYGYQVDNRQINCGLNRWIFEGSEQRNPQMRKVIFSYQGNYDCPAKHFWDSIRKAIEVVQLFDGDVTDRIPKMTLKWNALEKREKGKHRKE